MLHAANRHLRPTCTLLSFGFKGLLFLLRLLSITSAIIITIAITICIGNSTSISNSIRIILYAQGRESGLSMAARRHLHTCCGHFVSRFLHDIAGGSSYLLTAQDGITSTARSLQLSSGLLTRLRILAASLLMVLQMQDYNGWSERMPGRTRIRQGLLSNLWRGR